jgi:hypothetical protein
MSEYDQRRITLDPGLTALALRGLHAREESYPFLDRYTRRRARAAPSNPKAIVPAGARARDGGARALAWRAGVGLAADWWRRLSAGPVAFGFRWRRPPRDASSVAA